jgi:hypothetical protein
MRYHQSDAGLPGIEVSRHTKIADTTVVDITYFRMNYEVISLDPPRIEQAGNHLSSISLISRPPFYNTERITQSTGPITSKHCLVASVGRQHKKTAPCSQAFVDVNTRVEALQALLRATADTVPKTRDVFQLAARGSFHPPSRAENTITGSIAAAVGPSTRRN